MSPPGKSRLLSALEANWQAENEGYYTYLALSEREQDVQRRSA